MVRYVVVDTETTGFSPDRDRVVWISAAVVEADGAVSDRWSVVLNPGAGRRTHVNGLPLVDQPSFADVAATLSTLLQRGVMVAHNAAFDQAFLAAEYDRAGLVMPTVPMICTMRLAQRLGLHVSSLSLVDCCGYFHIAHVRRHNADEDVQATVQLLAHLLPLASDQGWDNLQSLQEALAPVERGGSGELSYSIDVDRILAEHLIEKAGWHPEDEPIDAAWDRYGAKVRVERDAAYARMHPDHRAAHQQVDAFALGETRASQWLPALDALDAAKCPEAPDMWVTYAKRIQGTKRNAKRALKALHRALELRFSGPAPSRTAVNDAVTWLNIVCDDANLLDELIDAYRHWGPRLATLAPCGECGDLGSGCRGGQACTVAGLAAHVVLALTQGFTSDDSETRDALDPGLTEQRIRTILPLLADEPDLWPYVHLGSWFSRLLVSRQRNAEALELWNNIVNDVGAQDIRRLPAEADRLGQAFAAARDYAGAIIVTVTALDLVQRQGQGSDDDAHWRTADHLGTYFERTGRLDDAKQVWLAAIGSGSDVANTFDRLSLTLEREGQYAAAADICELGWKRFSREVRRFKYAVRIRERGERCREHSGHTVASEF